MILTYVIILSLSAAFFSFVGTFSVRYMSEMFGGARVPNIRDNHTKPVPKGAGIAVMLSIIGFLCVLGMNANILCAVLLLIFVSAIDDFRGLSPLLRLIFHVIAAMMMVAELPAQIVPALPQFVEHAILVVGMVWFMNIYNFMDGIDEITALQTTMICLGLILISMIAPNIHNSVAYDNLIIISSVIGFWYFNRHPATIFLGDSGSIGLGALMAWFLMSLASKGLWVEALILPAYYLLDSGLTFAKRLLCGKKPWQAHSEHAYQQFVRGGYSHNMATKILTFYNLLMLMALLICLYKPQFRLLALSAIYGLAMVIYIYFASAGAKMKNRKTKNIVKYASS